MDAATATGVVINILFLPAENFYETFKCRPTKERCRKFALNFKTVFKHI
jgi:hypothetical protein